jgi:chromosome segregation ATPase
MALVLREAELNRREAALRRAEEAQNESRAEEAQNERNAEEARAKEQGSLARASSTLQEELEARLAEVERRERELVAAVEAVESQRERLESVRAEYESRREALAERTREVESERDRLRDEQAHLVCASLELEERELAVVLGPRPSAPVLVPEPEVEAVVEAALPVEVREEADVVVRASISQEPQNDTEWWSKQLGSPLEAA